MSKLEKILRREKRLIELSQEQRVYCNKHHEYLTPFTIVDKHCYNGRHGSRYCKYVRFDNEGSNRPT